MILSTWISVRSLGFFVETQKIKNIAALIKEKKVCANSLNIIECSYENFKAAGIQSKDPFFGQEMLADIVNSEMQTHPEKARFLKDQYFIYTSKFYIHSLTQKKKSLIGHLPLLSKQNIEIKKAKLFYKSMNDYSNRREIDRTIASEPILQEVSNFNSTIDELNQLISSFN